jgi:hypothetical protein
MKELVELRHGCFHLIMDTHQNDNLQHFGKYLCPMFICLQNIFIGI